MSLSAPLRKRKKLVQRVAMDLGRELGTVSVFFHQAIANKLGLNVTDTRCFELMSRYAQDDLTAGQLARATGFTTGAVTGILDRLEKAGLVERIRDLADRRKVFVRPRPDALNRVGRLYEGLAEGMMNLASTYSTSELALIDDYMERTLRVFREQSAKFAPIPQIPQALTCHSCNEWTAPLLTECCVFNLSVECARPHKGRR